MHLTLSSPTRAYIAQATDEELASLREQLTYKDLGVAHELKRISKNHWFKSSNPEKWELTVKMLKEQVYQTLVFEEDGLLYIRPGSIPYLEGNIEIDNQIKYPKPKKVPWFRELPFELYPYQKESVEKLVRAKHGNVELCTGAGKSQIVLNICRETGFNCAVVAPSKSIFNELVNLFEKHLGKGKIGKFGDGKKSLKKITICIGDSLVNVKKGTPEWEHFSNLEAILIDESHLFSSETLEEVTHNLFANIPYRMFFSGTQIRNSGDTKLLQAIIGETVCKLTTKEAKEQGYISDHEYKIIEMESSNPNVTSTDPLELKRAHVLKNRNICAFIAKLANSVGEIQKKQTLVLVQELEQISMLIPLLKVPFSIAHSETRKDRLAELGLEKVDNAESVERFNRGEALVLVGSSAIQTGTNIYPVHYCCWWAGGASPIMVKQGAVGRSIRLGKHNPWKDKCVEKDRAIIVDFDVRGQYVMERHLESRLECYKESGSKIDYVRIK